MIKDITNLIKAPSEVPTGLALYELLINIRNSYAKDGTLHRYGEFLNGLMSSAFQNDDQMPNPIITRATTQECVSDVLPQLGVDPVKIEYLNNLSFIYW